MSPRSSSCSWSESGRRRRVPDIIDLDRYIRGGVRPHTRPHDTIRERLVVDCGGAGVRKSPGLATGAPVAAPPATSSDSDSGARPLNTKRFSHDSGLSDGSYRRRKYRPHKRGAGGGGEVGPVSRAHPPLSAGSMRAFRVMCEQALRDQQEQIARVAQLCERLADRPPREAAPSVASSESSTTSHSTRQTQCRKDKRRVDECKTYKIIMNKLDELNRLFATRATTGAKAAQRPRVAPSSGTVTVTVSDKVIATDSLDKLATVTNVQASTRCATSNAPRLVDRGVGSNGASSAERGLRGVAGGGRGSNSQQPPPPRRRPSPRAAHTIVKYSTSDASVSSRSLSDCEVFDLEDPLHLYAQAKRLQAMHATTHRMTRRERDTRQSRDSRTGRSLCARCRDYWRALMRYLSDQLCCPDT